MKKRVLRTFGFGLLLYAYGLPTVAQVASDDNEEQVVKIDARRSKTDYVEGQVLVKFKDATRVQVNSSRGMFKSTSVNHLTSLLQKFGVKEMEQLLPNEKPSRAMRKSKAYNGDVIQERDLSQLYRVCMGTDHAEEVLELVDELNTLDEVEFAEPNYRLHILADETIASSYSSNPLVGQQWYLDNYGVKELWNKPVINRQRPIIAIIDTGVDITHPDLKDNIWTNQAEASGNPDTDNDRNGFKNDVHGWDFINNTPKMRDNNSHGTHVAGIAAAANNSMGIVGANPQALIMPITVLQSDGMGDDATLIKGIDYAVKNGATVINMSIGTYANSNALRQALASAYQSAVIVAAAGNDGMCIYASHFPSMHQEPRPKPCFPAAYSFVLGVQATTASGTLAAFSNYDDDGPLSSCESTVQDPDGFNYELKAPGTNILSCIPGGGYKVLQGTSMSSPLVAGAVSALMMVKQYDSQEMLWADLLHSNNIAGAYNIVDHPAELEISRIVLRNRDQQIDYNPSIPDVYVGETLEIYPFVRTSFGSASNIKLKIAVPSGVEVISNDVNLGYNLDAYGKMTSKNPLVIKIPDEMPNASKLQITVQATCRESDQVFSNTFTLNVITMYTLTGLHHEDMTLTPDHVYYVKGRFGIAEGNTLTIKPGTRLEFGNYAGLYGLGKIIANGTPEAPIIFTAYNKSELWSGICVHQSSGKENYGSEIYINADTTLFTLIPTEATPIKMMSLWKILYYDTEENKPASLLLSDYLNGWAKDMSGREEQLTDPNYLTPVMSQLMSIWKGYLKKYPSRATDEMNQAAYVELKFPYWSRYTNPIDTISYCRIDGFSNTEAGGRANPYYKDCIIQPSSYSSSIDPYIYGSKNVFVGGEFNLNLLHANTEYTNFINNTLVNPLTLYRDAGVIPSIGKSHFFNNFFTDRDTKKAYMLEAIGSALLDTVNVDPLPYFGTGREDLLRPLIYEYGNTKDRPTATSTYVTVDLTNMPTKPFSEAHGIVWKVVVDGKDAQDEQEQLLPLGVGRHQFEVYFNRPMNKAVKPEVSFGVTRPYTQKSVSEDAGWNEDGTIYTAYKTIDGKTQSDGMNRIYVRGAEDNEFFPCPDEATRFNIMIQAAGALATGFQADAGLGCVKLKWNNENNDFEDAMGFNVYRYTQGEAGVNDTIRLNENILDISATSYIDDQVIPGQTYYYYYKVLSTALQEYDVSNVVAATPLTATRGDANGSGSVDVADVITTVNYVTGQAPKPFVFDAADMNSDKLIDIFDVVGIVCGILNPSLLAASMTEETAIYTIENGTLYVESPVAIAGVQVQLSVDSDADISVADDLAGFEYASSWLSANDYLFLAYSMSGQILSPGKHALLHIGNAQISSIRLSDAQGRNVNVVGNETTAVHRMGSKYIVGIALLAIWAIPSFSQVSNDNEDGVNKIDSRWAQKDYVPGQVLVKFKDSQRIQVNSSRGMFKSTNVSRLTSVLQKYGVDEMEQLLPNEKPHRQLRRAKAFNGEEIQERDLSQTR